MKLAKPELDVGIATLEPAAALGFYRDVMGFEPLPALSLGALGKVERLRVGEHVLKLYDFASRPEASEGGTGRAIGMRLLAFLLEDLDPVLQRLDASGLSYRSVPLQGAPNVRVVFARDADGNALELVGPAQPSGAERWPTRLQIGLTVADVQRSRDFYGRVLGFKEEPPMKLPRSMGIVGDERYGFLAGRTTVKFWAMDKELPAWTGAPARRTGIRLMTAAVEDVNAACEDLRERGVPIKAEPHDLEGLARVMFIADPDGNWIELTSPL